MSTTKVRNYKYDNIRFFLIFLVVLCHLLGELSGSTITGIYKIVYSFHMPAFLFLSGYFAKFNGRKLITNFVLPYLIFQVLYKLFNFYIVHESDKLVLQFTSPRYILWYLYVLIIFYLLLPLFSCIKGWERIAAFILTIVCALWVGYDTANTNPAFYRAFAFLPYFVAGFYIGHPENGKKFEITNAKTRNLITAILGVLCLVSSYLLLHFNVSKTILYAKTSYSDGNYNPGIRILIMLVATIWIGFIFLVFKNKKLPILSGIGSRTLAIFILHGFIIKYLRYIDFFRFSEGVNLAIAIVLAFALVLILGSKPVYKAFNYIFCGGFINKIIAATRVYQQQA